MGRLEAFALGNKVWPSFLDAIGNALGYAWILVAVSLIREVLGSGKIWGYEIFPDSFYELGYMNNNMMILPPMALITVALIIWVQRSRNTDLIEEN
jgi:Na+-transporting NADH:ubiquinone oxidoreductase subunit D